MCLYFSLLPSDNRRLNIPLEQQDDVKVLGTFMKEAIIEASQRYIVEYIEEIETSQNKQKPVDTEEDESNGPINDNITQRFQIIDGDILTKKCEKKARDILTSSWKKMNHAIQLVHNKENERKNHMRYHYDDKLSICRVSNKLQNHHDFKVLQLRKMEEEAAMQGHYEYQIQELTAKLHHANDIIRVQESTVVQSQIKAIQLEKELKETTLAYDEYKTFMSKKYNTLENDWNRIKKQEVWAHFKIMHLKKKVKRHEKSLLLKKSQHGKLIKEIKELSDRLRVSMEIRTGMEKSFEKRASIRNRLDILNQQEMMKNCKPPQHHSSQQEGFVHCFQNNSCRPMSCQTEHQIIEMKDVGTDVPPYYHNIVKVLQCNIAFLQTQLINEREEAMVRKRQNEAFKRLVSGKNLALILASEQKNLIQRPNSMEAKILYQLTQPKGVLSDKKQTMEQKKMEKTSTPTTCISNYRPNTCSIPSSSCLDGFDGIRGSLVKSNRYAP